jgi:CheY-like chemotaxis protein
LRRVVREPAAAKVLAGIHVLVADPDVEMRDLLESVLTYCGALVTLAVSAADVLAVLDRDRPDVVIADLDVAGEHGELLGRLRALGPRPPMPVVAVVSGRDLSAHAILSAGFAAQVRKPIDPWALCRVVASLARKT